MPISEQAARRALQSLLADFEKLSPDERKTMSEASVVRQFVDRLLEEVLGWPVKDPARYKYEMHTQAGRPDLTLFPEQGGTIFIEAKRFGIIKQLEQARYTISGTITPGQMALPGMSVDRTEEEQQAINYAFANGGTWAILTNFEKLRLFNARRDWLVLSFEEPSAYLRDFDLLWQLAYHNVVAGSLDVLSNQRHTEEVDTQYLHFINEWRERLARDIISRRDQNAWAFLPDGGVNLPLLRFVVQRFLDRLVIVRFAEDHLVIPPGTLRQFLELRSSNPYTFTLDEFIDRFFRVFDRDHNSALFAPGVVDEASFSYEVLIPLVSKLYEARYRAMPADILGNTYEQYLGKALALDNGSVTTRDNLETRKKQGSYYTPQVIVRYIVDTSLGRYLYGTDTGKPDGASIPGETRKTAADIHDLRVLDSACGSGSFLIYAYYVLADFYESELQRLETLASQRITELAAQGVSSPLDLQIQVAPIRAEIERINDYPRLILETHLYGVDLDPQAAEIAVVNLMMRAMERRHREKRLPLILNQNVKVGNALVGLRPDDPRLMPPPTPSPSKDSGDETTLKSPLSTEWGGDLGEGMTARLAAIRQFRADLVHTPNGPDHDRIIHDLETATAGLNALLDADFTAHFTDLERVCPFHWGVEFPEVFFNDDGTPKANPGFTIIFGNPPWEILKPDLREFYAQFDERIESHLTRAQAEQRIGELSAEDSRRPALFAEQTRSTEQTAAYVRQSADYVRQGRGDTATHKLFIERAWMLLADGGRLGYVVPSGIYTDLGTKDLRQMLLNEGSIQHIFSFSNERFFFHGVDHRFKFCLLGAHKGPQTDGFWAAFRFNPRVAVAPDDLPAFLANRDNLIYVRRDSLERFSPDSLSVMEFQSGDDYAIAEKIYNGWPLLGDSPPRHVMARGSGGEDIRDTFAPVYTTPDLWDKLKPLARQMRHEPTPAEQVLWEQLRNRALDGLKFRRQHPIDRFIVDFYCAEAYLVVEVDGPIHDYTPDEDALRQAYLESLGLLVLRVSNDAVLSDMDGVLRQIVAAAQHPHPPAPSPCNGEGEPAGVWSVKFTAEFHITNDRHLFNTQGRGLPLYEGKMIHQFDAFYESPQFWLEEEAASKRLAEKYQVERQELDYLKPRLAYRGIARSTDQRTLMAAILPPRVFSEGRSATTVIQQGITISEQLFLAGCMNSLVLDWLLRLKVAANVNMFHIYSLPLPRLSPGDPFFDAIVPRAAQLTCTRAEFAPLWREVMGTDWTPDSVLSTQHSVLRNEIDALVAHLYGLTRAEFDHILGTFPLVFPDTPEGQAKRAELLHVFDSFVKV